MRFDRSRYLRKVLLLGALIGVAGFLVAGPASGFPGSTTVNCAPYGHDDLQSALDSYTVINVRGTCYGNFFVNSSGKTIQGATPGAGINGRGNGTDLSIDYGMLGTVTIQNMTFTNGYDKYGGGIYVYGAITVNLTNSIVRGNRAFVGGAGIYAGGDAVLNLTGTTVTRNSAAEYGGGVYLIGADLSATASTFSLNDTLLNGSVIPGNGGGGIFVEGGDASLTNSRVTTNKTLGYGGGIALVGQAHEVCQVALGGACVTSQGKNLATQDEPLVSELTLTSSSVDHNLAQGDGGGIYSDAGNIDFSSPADTSVTLDAATVSFNSAAGGDGGGIANYGECGHTAGVLATGTSFQGNQARNGEGGAVYNATGRVCQAPGTALVTIAKSAVANGPSVVNSNQAERGGGIANEQDDGLASLSLQPGAKIQGNKASVTGGGVFNECGSFSSLAQIMLNSPNNVVSVC